MHIITGFLGVGKTSCIQHMIKNKPHDERWAVLVNEYGQQGIDGQLYDANQVIVKQVAGGCACCAALLPFQTAMNELIRFDSPDRILIEPSGLGHVDNIVKRLKEDDYQTRIHLHAVACVVDPRHLSQPKYRYHELYIRQLFAADILVANKTELSSAQDIAQFEQLVKEFRRPSIFIEQARLSLDDITVPVLKHHNPLQLHAQQQQDFYSQVVCFEQTRWQIEPLVNALLSLQFMRIKALIVQEDQVIAINISDAQASVQSFISQLKQQSVIECINDNPISLSTITQVVKESQADE